MNPLGFTLEHYDAIGRFRDRGGRQAGRRHRGYQGPDGRTVSFAGARDLATYLAASDEVHGAFVEKLFHQVVQQPIRAYGPDRLAELRPSFARNGFRIRDLMVEIVASTALGPDAAEARAAQAVPQPPSQSPPAGERKRAIAPEEQVVTPDPEK